MNPVLKLKLSSLLGKRFREDRDIGIEIEVEGELLGVVRDALYDVVDDEPARMTDTWRIKMDGSLRHGAEFVTTPIYERELDEAMDEWVELVEDCTLYPTIRTSTHVHFNAKDITGERFVKFYLVYGLIENALITAQGENRVGNIYCLPIEENAAVFESLCEDLSTDDPLSGVITNPHKYAALNLNPLMSIGTIELRMFKPTLPNNIEDLKVQIRALLHLWKHYPGLDEMSANELLTQYTKNRPAFLNQIFGGPQMPAFLATASDLGLFWLHEMFPDPAPHLLELADRIDFSKPKTKKSVLPILGLGSEDDITDDDYYEDHEPAPTNATDTLEWYNDATN